MSYLILNTKTKKPYKKPSHLSAAHYPTERGAKIAATKLNKKVKFDLGEAVRRRAHNEPQETWVAMSREKYAEKYPVKMIERTNLMSGKKYMEAEDTPLCCSPASETYWSM